MKKEGKMRQGKLIFTFFLMAGFIGMSFAGSSLIAGQIPITTTCTLINPSTGTPTLFVITANVGPNGQFPIFDTSNNSYKWEYRLSNYTSSNSKIAMLIPNCSNPALSVVLPDPNGFTIDLFNAGVSPSDISKFYFGRWTDHDNVLKINNFNAGVGLFSINTKSNDSRQMTIQVSGGNNYYWCQGIIGPACPEKQAQGTVSSVTTYTSVSPDGGTASFCTLTDPKTQCEYVLADCTDPTSIIENIPGDPRVKDFTDLNFGSAKLNDISVPGKACPQVIISDTDPLNTCYYCNKYTNKCTIVPCP